MGSYERVFIQLIYIGVCQVLRVGRGIAWLLVNVIGQKDSVKNADPQGTHSQTLQLLYQILRNKFYNSGGNDYHSFRRKGGETQ